MTESPVPPPPTPAANPFAKWACGGCILVMVLLGVSPVGIFCASMAQYVHFTNSWNRRLAREVADLREALTKDAERDNTFHAWARGIADRAGAEETRLEGSEVNVPPLMAPLMALAETNGESPYAVLRSRKQTWEDTDRLTITLYLNFGRRVQLYFKIDNQYTDQPPPPPEVFTNANEEFSPPLKRITFTPGLELHYGAFMR